MITFIAFLLTILGCVNWLMIGLLQYDFIAGLFGFQASIFSRLCYILIGVGAGYLIIRIIVNKGTLKVYERRKKKGKQLAEAAPAVAANVEAGNEQISSKMQTEERHAKKTSESDENYESYQDESENQDNLFDEHFKEN